MCLQRHVTFRKRGTKDLDIFMTKVHRPLPYKFSNKTMIHVHNEYKYQILP